MQQTRVTVAHMYKVTWVIKHESNKTPIDIVIKMRMTLSRYSIAFFTNKKNKDKELFELP